MHTADLAPLFIIGFFIYFLPTIIAFGKGRANTLAIFALNLFLGFSGIAWVIALVWALTEDNIRVKRDE